jgi:hypothetical protein
MDIEALWNKARRETEIIRLRVRDLETFQATRVSYIFLAESSVNTGDTVVRRGDMLIEKPSLHLPHFSPLFEGIKFDPELHLNGENLATFLLMRGVRMPSLRYCNREASLDVVEGSLSKAIERFHQELLRAEDTTTGLVVGPEEAWQFSLVLFIGALVIRSADGDIRRILDKWRRDFGES